MANQTRANSGYFQASQSRQQWKREAPSIPPLAPEAAEAQTNCSLSPSLPFPLCSAAPFDQVRVRGVKVKSYVVTRTEIRDVGKQMRG